MSYRLLGGLEQTMRTEESLIAAEDETRLALGCREAAAGIGLLRCVQRGGARGGRA